MNTVGAGNTFSMSLTETSTPRYEDHENSIYDYRYMNHTQMIKPYPKKVPPNVFLGAEEIAVLPEGMNTRNTGRLRPFFALRDIAKGEQLVWNYEYHQPCQIIQGQCSCGLPETDCYEFKKRKSGAIDREIEQVLDCVTTSSEGTQYLARDYQLSIRLRMNLTNPK